MPLIHLKLQKPSLGQILKKEKLALALPKKSKLVDAFDIFDQYDLQSNLEQRRKAWLKEVSRPTLPDQFICLALQHKTQDFIAVVKDQPKQAVFVEATNSPI